MLQEKPPRGDDSTLTADNSTLVPGSEEEVIEVVPSEKVNIAKIDDAKAKLGFGLHKTMTYNAVWSTLPGYVMAVLPIWNSISISPDVSNKDNSTEPFSKATKENKSELLKV